MRQVQLVSGKWIVLTSIIMSMKWQMLILKKYDIRDFANESENPIIEKVITFKNGTKVPIFELWRIVGTVIDKK